MNLIKQIYLLKYYISFLQKNNNNNLKHLKLKIRIKSNNKIKINNKIIK